MAAKRLLGLLHMFDFVKCGDEIKCWHFVVTLTLTNINLTRLPLHLYEVLYRSFHSKEGGGGEEWGYLLCLGEGGGRM